jgi:hypothetical protein
VPRAESKNAAKQLDRQAIIDELGEVERQFRLWTPGVNPHAARLAELNAIVDSWYKAFDPELSDVQESPRYRLEIKPCQFKRDLTPEAEAAAFLKLKRVKVQDGSGKLVPLDLFSLFHLTQAIIVKYLGEAYLDEIAPQKRTGRRTYKLVPKAGPQLVKSKEKAA